MAIHQATSINYKGKRVAAAAQTDAVNYNPIQEAPSTAVPALTPQQYDQLMQRLNKQTTDAKTTNDGIGAVGFMAGKRHCLFTSFANKTWILDSGASDHITLDISLLHNVRPIRASWYITTPNGKRAQITQIGFMLLTTSLILENVLHVPEFHFNLLSISKLTNQFQVNVIFIPHACLL